MARSLSPINYTLGTGHCRFFYIRLLWLRTRFQLLVAEMLARGYEPTHRTIPDWTRDIPAEWWGPYYPSYQEVDLNIERINERLRGMGLADQQIVL